MHNLGGSHFSIKLFPRIQPNERVKTKLYNTSTIKNSFVLRQEKYVLMGFFLKLWQYCSVRNAAGCVYNVHHVLKCLKTYMEIFLIG